MFYFFFQVPDTTWRVHSPRWRLEPSTRGQQRANRTMLFTSWRRIYGTFPQPCQANSYGVRIYHIHKGRIFFIFHFYVTLVIGFAWWVAQGSGSQPTCRLSRSVWTCVDMPSISRIMRCLIKPIVHDFLPELVAYYGNATGSGYVCRLWTNGTRLWSDLWRTSEKL